MAKTGESTDLVKCSFCRKSQKQVTKLVAGPNVYICNECINLCNDIIEQELAETTNVSASEGDVPWNVLTPPGSTDVSLNLRAIQQRIAALASEVQTLIYWIENPPEN